MIMWPGALKQSWTSGTGGNNANYVNGDMRFQSGPQTLDYNRFMMKVKNPGRDDYVKGFIVQKNTECNFHFKGDIIGPRTTYEISVLTKK